MYQVFCDGKVLHDMRDENYMLLSPKITQELNKTGNFDFGILSAHPEIRCIEKLKSSVAVYDGDELLYAGRPTTDESDFYNFGRVTCEGELSFLLDSVQRPHNYGSQTAEAGKADTNVEIFKRLVEEHNGQVEEEKQFAVGIVDIDSETITKLSTNYEKTWDFINSNFLGKYEGYLRVRYSGGIRHLDYVRQYGKVSAQEIRFGENLLDLKRHIKAEDIVTAIIPVGKNNVTVKTANGHDGTDYIYDPAAVELYGWIYEKVDFPEVNDPDTLLMKAREELRRRINLAITIELTATDLHMVDVDINGIRLGDLVPCISREHGLLSIPGDVSTYYLVSKYEVNLDNPGNNKLTLGRTVSTLTGQMANATNENSLIRGIAYNAGILADAANETANQAANEVELIKNEIGNVTDQVDGIINKVYPVGSIYLSVNPTNPSGIFGGRWEAWGVGRMPVGVDASDSYFNEPGKTGGSKWLQSHSHTLGNHTHSVNINTNSNGAHTHGVYGKTAAAKGSTYRTLGIASDHDIIRQTVSAGAHAHNVAGSTGGNNGKTSDHNLTKGSAHNLPPYIACYMWKRVS